MLNIGLSSPELLVLYLSAIVIYFSGGVVKGTLGIGFPTTVVSLLAQVADARTAITVVIIPMVITNLWQVLRSSDLIRLTFQYRTLIICMLVFIALFSQIAVRLPAAMLTAILGVVIVIYATHSLFATPFVLPPAMDRPAQWIAGATAGIMGGLVSVWAPPILLYLRAKGLDREQFVASVGIFLLAGSSVLLLSYLNNGLLGNGMWQFSTLLVIPALIGFAVGELIRRKLSAKRFERLLLWFFLIMGLNLIRRGLF
ncbi:MAG: sulfite exporter TauE/SafE family protein [Granulosicoccus sp.]|nr:sulfite exporter TauE/SafE family protein [Granulosicoccus sp.]